MPETFTYKARDKSGNLVNVSALLLPSCRGSWHGRAAGGRRGSRAPHEPLQLLGVMAPFERHGLRDLPAFTIGWDRSWLIVCMPKRPPACIAE